jgi:hypothetical protein
MVTEVEYTPHGASRDLFGFNGPECVIEGPAGTGKTRGVLEKVNFLCETYPGIRVLFLRATRTSMNESVLETWENKVLWPSHPCLMPVRSRETRSHYEYPNGSHVVLFGLDKPGRTFSSEYDVVIVFEAWETLFDAWQKLARCMRNNVLPWQQRIADTNPAEENHWINELAADPEERMGRLLSRHVDNPTLTAAYLEDLRLLKGVNRARLFEGRWVSVEGQVWPSFTWSKHVLSAARFRHEGYWWLDIDGWPADRKRVRIEKWYGSIDWGYKDPGVFQAWGVDGDGRAYRAIEIYRTGKTIDWWAEQIARVNRVVDLRQIFCDHDPGKIEKLNDRLSRPGRRNAGRLAINANKAIEAGVDHVRDMLDGDANGPFMYFLNSAAMTTDADRVRDRLPWCTEREIGSYVFPKGTDGKPRKTEKPDPACEDHGCDATRYFAMGVWKRSTTDRAKTERYDVGTEGWFVDLGMQPNVKKRKLWQT